MANSFSSVLPIDHQNIGRQFILLTLLLTLDEQGVRQCKAIFHFRITLIFGEKGLAIKEDN